jgi:hypothetical protein
METLSQERKTIEQRWPGWHVWQSDAGKWYATRDYHDACGCGVTVTPAGFALIEHEIAVWERAHEREIRRIGAPALAGAA